MAYKDYATVADQVYKQADAMINAVDQAQNGKKNPPEELDELTDLLTQVKEVADGIMGKAETGEGEDPDEEWKAGVEESKRAINGEEEPSDTKTPDRPAGSPSV